MVKEDRRRGRVIGYCSDRFRSYRSFGKRIERDGICPIKKQTYAM